MTSQEKLREQWRRAANKRYYANRQQLIVEKTESQKKRVERNIEFITQAKSVPCTDCGLTFPPYVMDFDHLRDKVDNISRMVYSGWGLKRIQDEVDKCDVVCANCHRIRTYGGVE